MTPPPPLSPTNTHKVNHLIVRNLKLKKKIAIFEKRDMNSSSTSWETE